MERKLTNVFWSAIFFAALGVLGFWCAAFYDKVNISFALLVFGGVMAWIAIFAQIALFFRRKRECSF